MIFLYICLWFSCLSTAVVSTTGEAAAEGLGSAAEMRAVSRGVEFHHRRGSQVQLLFGSVSLRRKIENRKALGNL